MAKIHKVEMFMLDVNEDFDSLNDIIEYLCSRRYAPKIHIVKSKSKEFEWDDDVVVNKCSCTTDEYNEFFDGLEG